MPAACSLTRSLRAFSSGERSSSPADPIVRGSATIRCVPASVSSTHRQVTGSVPPLVRRNATRRPSGEMVNERGIPSVNRRVLAYWRGKLSVMVPILSGPVPRGAPGLRGSLRCPDMSPPDSARSVLLVHAHPDDESIATGGIMAKYAAQRAHVTLVTCTLGEMGEVIPAELDHLRAGREDRLGEYRMGELAAACAELGVSDRRFLGGPGRWRDSGMMGTEGNDDPRCFWRADVDQAADALLDVIREVRPQVLVSYDANGFYGHPDHIQAHRVACRAFQQATDLGLAKFYATARPESAGVTTEIDGTAYLGRKLAAMRAHATQITVDPPFFALSDQIRHRALGVEYFTLLAGPGGPGSGPG